MGQIVMSIETDETTTETVFANDSEGKTLEIDVIDHGWDEPSKARGPKHETLKATITTSGTGFVKKVDFDGGRSDMLSLSDDMETIGLSDYWGLELTGLSVEN